MMIGKGQNYPFLNHMIGMSSTFKWGNNARFELGILPRLFESLFFAPFLAGLGQ
jgi:hypothetical protein